MNGQNNDGFNTGRVLPPAEPWAGNYFVATYPPFSTWMKESVPEVTRVLGETHDLANAVPLGLYVHVPFCVRRCDYCYYLSYADKTADDRGEYVDAVIRELGMYASSNALAGRRPGFVYFGGGTPSFLDEPLIERLLQGLQQAMPWTDVREATFECAPRTVTTDKLQLLRRLGITRISIGAQTFDDDILKRNGRVHLREDIEQAYRIARDVGFDVLNIDLMVGLPGETEDSLDATLERVLELAPECVTIYQTEVPLNTPLYTFARDGMLSEPLSGWEVKRARLKACFETLERNGYTVRSAYAAVRDPQRHLFIYQDTQYHGADLLGLGVASFSYLNGVHYQNRTSYETYMTDISGDRLPLERAYRLSDEERMVREFVLQLKLGQAGNAYFRDKFGVDIITRFAAPLRELADADWLTVDDTGVTLTREGLLRADRLLSRFYLPEHREVRYS